MAENKIVLQKTTNRFIAFIDILGFKDLVSKNTHEEILKKLEKLNVYINKIKQPINSLEKYQHSKLYPYIFSDSIVIFTNDDSENTIELLLWACNLIFANSIKDEIPLKGAIAYGQITVDVDKSIFFGQPLIDAYLLQEEVKYYGMILHHSAEKFLKNITPTATLTFSVKTPTKHGNVVYCNILWIIYNIAGSKLNDINIYKLYDNVSGQARIYVDNTIEMYEKMKTIAIPPIV